MIDFSGKDFTAALNIPLSRKIEIAAIITELTSENMVTNLGEETSNPDYVGEVGFVRLLQHLYDSGTFTLEETIAIAYETGVVTGKHYYRGATP